MYPRVGIHKLVKQRSILLSLSKCHFPERIVIKLGSCRNISTDSAAEKSENSEPPNVGLLSTTWNGHRKLKIQLKYKQQWHPSITDKTPSEGIENQVNSVEFSTPLDNRTSAATEQVGGNQQALTEEFKNTELHNTSSTDLDSTIYSPVPMPPSFVVSPDIPSTIESDSKFPKVSGFSFQSTVSSPISSNSSLPKVPFPKTPLFNTPETTAKSFRKDAINPVNLETRYPYAIDASKFWPSMYAVQGIPTLPESLPRFIQRFQETIKNRISILRTVHNLANEAGLDFRPNIQICAGEEPLSKLYIESYDSIIKINLPDFMNLETAREQYLEIADFSSVIRNEDDLVSKLENFHFKNWRDTFSFNLKNLYKPKRLSVTDMTTKYCEMRSFYDLMLSQLQPSSLPIVMEPGNNSSKLFRQLLPYTLFDESIDLLENFVQEVWKKLQIEEVNAQETGSSFSVGEKRDVIYYEFQKFAYKLKSLISEDIEKAGISLDPIREFRDGMLNGRLTKMQNFAQSSGTQAHKELEDMSIVSSHLYIPDGEGLGVTSEDVWAKKLLTSMMQMKSLHLEIERKTREATDKNTSVVSTVREVYVFGAYHKNLISGIIDELTLMKFSKEELEHARQIEHTKIKSANDTLDLIPDDLMLVVTDTKTRMRPVMPPLSQRISAYHQTLLYHKLLSDLCNQTFNFEVLYETQGLDPDTVISWDVLYAFSAPKDSSCSENETAFSTEVSEKVFEIENKFYDFLDEKYPGVDHEVHLSKLPLLYGLGKYEDEYGNIVELSLPKVTLRDIQNMFTKTMRPFANRMSEMVRVEYIYKNSPRKPLTSGYNGSTSGIKVLANLAYEVDQERLDNLLQFSTDFWIGKRPPLGVESDEIGVKCGNCVWARVCDWRNKMESA